MGQSEAVVVTGVTSLVGHYLLPRLMESGFAVHALSRRPRPADVLEPVQWHVVDISENLSWNGHASGGIHLAPLWLLPPLIPALAARGVTRLVAFGSTSRFTKLHSTDKTERSIAARLAAAEQQLADACVRHSVALTLFRPTLIYGAGRDRNVSAIAGVIRRFGMFIVAGGAAGRRQPVHADDLAEACILALRTPSTAGRAYNLAGATTLTYREMVEEIFRGIGRRPRIVGMPAALLRAAARVAAVWPRVPLTPAMVDRMTEDLCFDWSAAARDFGYSPRAFAYPDGAGRASSVRGDGQGSQPLDRECLKS